MISDDKLVIRSPHLLPAFYFLIGAIWIGKLIGISGVVFLLIQPVMLFAVKNVSCKVSI